MKRRNATVLGGLVLISVWAIPTQAEEKIQAFIDSNGKVVYTNTVDNPTAPIPRTSSAAVAPTSGLTAPIHALIESISANNGVDPALVRAMIQTESNFNRWAVSSKGALGLMQLIPDTGARFGVRD